MTDFRKLTFLNFVILIFFFFAGQVQAVTINKNLTTTTTTTPPVANGNAYAPLNNSGNEMPVYIVMGQSNAVGVAQINKLPGMIVNDFKYDNWPFLYGSADGPTEVLSGVTMGPGSNIQTADKIQGNDDFGPDLMIASSVDHNGQKNFCIFKFAVGGSSLAPISGVANWFSAWTVDSVSGAPLYDLAKSAFTKAMNQLKSMGYTPVVKGIFWMQGESDAMFATAAPYYKAYFNLLIQKSRTDFQLGNNPFVFGMIQNDAAMFPYASIVRAAQTAALNNSSNGTIGSVEGDDLPRYSAACVAGGSAECVVHYTAEGQYRLGVRFFDEYAKLAYGVTPPQPQFLTVTKSGNSAKLSWSNIGDSTMPSPTITAAQVQISQDGGNSWNDVLSPSGVLSPIASNCTTAGCTVTLYAKGSYNFRVRVFSQGGFGSPWSAWSSWSNFDSDTTAAISFSGGSSTLNGTSSISANGITISTGNSYAGAIDSLTWNGMQFVSAYDHSSEFETALSFDGQGECENPTEAGSLNDGTSSSSTSKLYSISASGNVLITNTQMAYWDQPAQTSPGCSTGAINTLALSGEVMTKRVTIGFQGMSDVVEYSLALDMPETGHSSYNLEVSRVDMPFDASDFTNIYTYDPATNSLTPLTAPTTASGVANMGSISLPVIVATADGSHAMGVYSPGLPQANAPGSAGYLVMNISNSVMKIDCNYVQLPSGSNTSLSPGVYNYSCYYPVDTLANVETALSKLYQYFQQQQGVPPVTITSPAAGSTVSGSVTIDATGANSFGSIASGADNSGTLITGAGSSSVTAAGVQFLVDGQNLGALQTASPYSVTWDTSSLTAGSTHTLAATVTDTAGNQSTSVLSSVTVAGSGGNTSSTVPVYQFYSSTIGHFYSLSKNGGSAAGMAFQGIAFNVYTASSGATSALLYQCYLPTIGKFIVSKDKTCGGYTNEGKYGYIDTVLVGTDKVLYQYVSSDPIDQYVSTSKTTPDGYVSKGILGYEPSS